MLEDIIKDAVESLSKTGFYLLQTSFTESALITKVNDGYRSSDYRLFSDVEDCIYYEIWLLA